MRIVTCRLSSGVFAVVAAALALAVVAVPAVAGTGRGVSVYAAPEFQAGELVWSVAGEPDGTDPNILSELEWRELRAYGVRGGVEWRVWRRLALGAEVAYGRITEGTNTDSDYLFDNRRGLFSRSTAETEGYLADFEAAVALDFFGEEARFGVAPVIGGAFHRQHLNDTSGVQRVDEVNGETGPFGGLDSEYTADWTGGFGGVRLRAKPSRDLTLSIEARYYALDFEAEGVWNLRKDLRQNPSFRQEADAEGWSVKVSADWRFRPSWTAGVYLGWSVFSTDPGRDIVFSREDGALKTRLNEVEWDSFHAGLRLTREF